MNEKLAELQPLERGRAGWKVGRRDEGLDEELPAKIERSEAS